MFKGRAPLVIGMVLGLLAGLMAWVALSSKEKEIKRGWNLQEVVVAAEEITEGTKLEISQLAKRMMPEQFVTKSTIKPKDVDKVVGQVVVVNLHEGDPLQWSQFQENRGFEHLSNVIPKMGRAISIKLSPEAAVGNWVRPNDHVDVLGTFRDPVSGQMVTITLLQNVVVLATGKLTSATNVNLVPENDRNYSNATIAVLPEDAEIMVLAQDLGALYMSLRNPEDMSLRTSDRTRATIDTFLSGDKLRQLDSARGAIQVIRGGR